MHATAAATARVGGIPIPSAFTITATGTSAGAAFAPVAGTLRIDPAPAGAQQPFYFELSPLNTSALGSFSWLVAPDAPAGTRISNTEDRVIIEIETDGSDHLGPGWSSAATDPLFAGVPMPVLVRRARMEWWMDGGSIHGSITASGKPLLGSGDIAYEARFSGDLADGEQQPGAAADAAPRSIGAAFPLLEVAFPIFDLTLSGETDSARFSELPATLIFDRRPETFSLFLTSEGAVANGWIKLSSEPVARSAIVKADAGFLQIEMDLVGLPPMSLAGTSPSEAPTLSWFTNPPDPSHNGARLSVVGESLHMSLRIARDGEVTGDIKGTGRTLADKPTASRYRAKLKGQWRGAAVERLRRTMANVSFAGSWDTGDGHFGQLTLIQDGEGLRGSFLDQGGGSLEGRIEGRRADFIWRNNHGRTGWGFLRMAASHTVLIGLWDTDSDGSHVQAMVARRPGAPDIDTSRLTTRDRTELRYLGQELVSQGRCAEARVILDRAGELHEKVLKETHDPYIVSQDLLINQVNILNDLVTCDFEERNYDGLLGHLREALELQWRLGPVELSIRVFTDQLKELRGRLMDWTSSIQTMEANLRELRGQTREARLEAAMDATASRLRTVHDAMAGDIEVLDAVQRDVEDKRQAPERALADVAQRIERRSAEVTQANDTIVAQGRPLYEGEEKLLADRDALLTALRTGATNAVALAEREGRIIETLKGAKTLSSQAKAFFHGQMDACSYLITLAGVLTSHSRHIGGLKIQELIATRYTGTGEAADRLAQHVERWRGRLITDFAKIQSQEQAQEFYADLLRLWLDLGSESQDSKSQDSESQALIVSEMARSRAFLDLLGSRADVRGRIAEVYAQHAGQLPSPKSLPPMTLAEIKATVQDLGSTVVEYFLTDKELLIWVIGPNGEVTPPIRSSIDRKRLREQISSLRKLFEANEPDGQTSTQLSQRLAQESSAIRQHLTELGTALIPEHLRAHLPASPDAVITVIPHQELLYVPFGALIDANGRYLIERHTLAYASSIGVLKYIRSRRDRHPTSAKPRLLALVNPSPLPDVRNGPETHAAPSFGPLNQTQDLFEKAITSYYDSGTFKVLSEANATKAALRRRLATIASCISLPMRWPWTRTP